MSDERGLAAAETFLTVAEIANLFKLNPQTVRNWIDAGKLPAVRLGERRVRVRQSALERFILEGEDMKIVRTEPEVNEVLNRAAEGIDGGTRWPAMSYEEGVRNGIDWLTGNSDDNPMDD